jgi:phosphoribosylformimino-5-aminoimidazole carboxamide ribonucleotide (ProFAR) isomerase
MTQEKTINEFVKEMKEQFGNDIEMKVTAPDGTVFKQTTGWLTDEQLAKSEKERKAKLAREDARKNGYRKY